MFDEIFVLSTAMVRSSLHMSLNSTDPYVLEIRWQPPSVQLPSDINLTSFWIYKITINQVGFNFLQFNLVVILPKCVHSTCVWRASRGQIGCL